MTTGCAVSSRWRARPENSSRWCGRALVEARTAASNQLWAIRAEHWPGAAVVFQKLTSQITLAFLTDYPTPQTAALLGEGRMGQFCRQHGYRGGKSPSRARPQAPRGPSQREPHRANNPRSDRA